MGSLNKVFLIGYLGKDPEIKSTQSGTKLANLTVATSESWTDKRSGERKEVTEWNRVVIYNEHLVKIAEQYLQKGQQVFLEGTLKTRKWTDQSGQERYTTEIILQNFKGEIVMLGSKGGARGEDAEHHQQDQGYANQGSSSSQRAAVGRDDLDDEIPF